MNSPITRLVVLIAAAFALAAGGAEAAPLHLVRVVLVTRHGVRPPTQSNAELAKYSDKAWPDWPVAPGELTPHGGQTVKLMGETLREAYRAQGLIPRRGCAGSRCHATCWQHATGWRCAPHFAGRSGFRNSTGHSCWPARISRRHSAAWRWRLLQSAQTATGSPWPSRTAGATDSRARFWLCWHDAVRWWDDCAGVLCEVSLKYAAELPGPPHYLPRQFSD